MLQEITRITPSIADAIATQYPDVRSLVGAFRRHGDSVLADLEVSFPGQRVTRGGKSAKQKLTMGTRIESDYEERTSK
jgi:hypothetical protein